MKIVNVDEMRRVEQAADQAGQSYGAMMDMAGQAVASIADQVMLSEPGSDILVLVGPGNNGGDGLVAARRLLDMGHRVVVYVWKRDIKGDDNFRLLRRRRRQISILWADNDPGYVKLREETRHAALIIDALLGTGVARPIEGSLLDLLHVVKEESAKQRELGAALEEPRHLGFPRFPILEAMTFGIPLTGNGWPAELETERAAAGLSPDSDGEYEEPEFWTEADGPFQEAYPDEDDSLFPAWLRPGVLAVDCPTGLNCDTGELDPAALGADLTVTFGFPKWGHVQFPGASACGVLSVVDIGVPIEIADQIRADLLDPEVVRGWLPGRPPTAHKGTFGKVMIAAGSLWYTGAAYLSAAAATRAGSGLVTLAIPAPLHASLAGQLPEATWFVLPGPEGVHCADGAALLLDDLEGYDAILAGPGLTTRQSAREFVQTFLAFDEQERERWAGRVVVDADALNILADMEPNAWPRLLPPNSILTPHPGEMARLTRSTIDEVNAGGLRSHASGRRHGVIPSCSRGHSQSSRTPGDVWPSRRSPCPPWQQLAAATYWPAPSWPY
jgi:NAD(P)H-hydrate epimerase